LDRRRPLWEIWCIEGLEHGRLAVLAKVHHAMADGVGGATLLGALLGVEPTPIADEPLRSAPGEPVPSAVALLAHAAGSAATLPWRFARASGRTLGSVVSASRRRGTGGHEAAAPFRAPRTSFNHPVTASRSVAFTSASLTDVKRVKDAAGATVNDVVLALCAGALRSYLTDLGELPAAPLVAAVPVSRRSGHEIGSYGNVVSGWFTSLATDVDDPLERLLAVRSAAEGAKTVYESGIEDVVMQWADLPVPALWALGIRLYTAAHLSTRLPPIFNLLISNVPGAPFPVYAGPAPVVAMYPFGPVLDSIGINITVLSYQDSLDFGILTCPELVPDPWRLAEAIPVCLRELVEATGSSGDTPVRS
jgi:WS/DGAT/MGAT family acyltransferase